MIVKGKVVDANTGESLPNANVSRYIPVNCITFPCAPQLVGGTTSDINGEFQLSINAGEFVKISYVGYRTDMPIFIDNLHKVVKLSPSAASVPEATATAKRTYNRYYLAAAVALIVLFIHFKA